MLFIIVFASAFAKPERITEIWLFDNRFSDVLRKVSFNRETDDWKTVQGF